MRRDALRIAAHVTLALDPLRARLRRREIRDLARSLAREGIPPEPPPMVLAMALLSRASKAAEQAGEPRAGMDERALRRIARMQGLREACLHAAGSLTAQAVTAALVSGAQVPADAPERRVAEKLLPHVLDLRAPWTVRTEALGAIARILLAQDFSPPPQLASALDERADDAEDHRWVQVAALRALAATDPGRARRRARARLLMPRPSPDDAVVRAKMVRILLGELHDVEAAIALGACARDPSEHVRQSTARACQSASEPTCRTLLSRLADPAQEKSPRVRGVVAEVLAGRALGDAGEDERMPAAEALCRMIREDPDPLPRLVACDAAAFACESPSIDGQVAGALVNALESARAHEVPAPLCNAIARAAERARLAVDHERGRLASLLRAAAASVPETEATTLLLPAPCADHQLGRTLAVLAQEDFGLYARRDGNMVLLRRGDRVGRQAWRTWHEVLHPIPTKRQGALHTVGRILDAPLRAHPGGLAEVTRTRVPGERVLVPREGGWAPYLPLVDDLLSCVLPGEDGAKIYSEHGVTIIEPPTALSKRILIHAELTSRYAELAFLRLYAIEASDPRGRVRYVEAVHRLGFRLSFRPYPGLRPPRHVAELFADMATDRKTARVSEPLPVSGIAPIVPLVPLAESAQEILRSLGERIGERLGGGVAELAAFTAASIVLLVTRSMVTRAEVRACRRAVPLVIGGWGTRGKSGVERLKGALFHALGYEVIVKTTGCEATVMIGVPGRPLVEIPLYRPYEKATIWEQRDVLRLAGRRKPHVLCWECMALNPRYVDLLQRSWMRDDLSTITNAYPDHEDIQGPSGLDVARVIARFTPKAAKLVTSEEQMLPVLKEEARAMGTTLLTVRPHEHELFPEDLLERFPYREHPRNLALVVTLAEELGIDRDVALVEMAEHVLPDIGGLMAYGPIPIVSRRLRFVNGMSANERASALGNWRRCGFEEHDASADPSRWIVAFVNNRADRGARTLTFADAIVEDLAAHRFVLVGTSVEGMRRAIDEAIKRRLFRMRPPELPELITKLKIGQPTAAAARNEIATWLLGIGASGPADLVRADEELGETLREVLAPPRPESLEEARERTLASGVRAQLLERLECSGLPAECAEEIAAFATESWVRKRAAAGTLKGPELPVTRQVLHSIFLESLIIPPDPTGEADDLLELMARSCPPGVLCDVMGLQNIKGPGLAVVYRMAAAERALAMVAALSSPSDEVHARAAEGLKGMSLPSRVIHRACAEELRARARGLEGNDREELVSLARLHEELATRSAESGQKAGRKGATRHALAWVLRSLDHVRSVGRRRRADRVFDDLAHERISCEEAAQLIATLLAQQRR